MAQNKTETETKHTNKKQSSPRILNTGYLKQLLQSVHLGREKEKLCIHSKYLFSLT